MKENKPSAGTTNKFDEFTIIDKIMDSLVKWYETEKKNFDEFNISPEAQKFIESWDNIDKNQISSIDDSADARDKMMDKKKREVMEIKAAIARNEMIFKNILKHMITMRAKYTISCSEENETKQGWKKFREFRLKYHGIGYISIPVDAYKMSLEQIFTFIFPECTFERFNVTKFHVDKDKRQASVSFRNIGCLSGEGATWEYSFDENGDTTFIKCSEAITS